MRPPAFPDPVRAAAIRDPEHAATVRRLDCRLYNHCLSIAECRRWDGFGCNDCHAYRPISLAERIADEHPLINCMAEAFRRGHVEYRTTAEKTKMGRML